MGTASPSSSTLVFFIPDLTFRSLSGNWELGGKIQSTRGPFSWCTRINAQILVLKIYAGKIQQRSAIAGGRESLFVSPSLSLGFGEYVLRARSVEFTSLFFCMSGLNETQKKNKEANDRRVFCIPNFYQISSIAWCILLDSEIYPSAGRYDHDMWVLRHWVRTKYRNWQLRLPLAFNFGAFLYQFTYDKAKLFFQEWRHTIIEKISRVSGKE